MTIKKKELFKEIQDKQSKMVEQKEKEDLIENKMRLYYLLREIQKETDLY